MKIEIYNKKGLGASKFEVDVNGSFYCIAKLPFTSVQVGGTKTSMPITFLDQNENEFCKTDPIKEYGEADAVVGAARVTRAVLGQSDRAKSQIKFNFSDSSITVYDDFKGLTGEGSLKDQLVDMVDLKTIVETPEKTYSSRELSNAFFEHDPIYDGEVQIGEILRPKGTKYRRYCCFLRDEYAGAALGIISLIIFKLYKNRGDNTSSIGEPSDEGITTGNVGSYDKNWLANNFGAEYRNEINQDITLIKEQGKKDSILATIITLVIAIFCLVCLFIGQNDTKTTIFLIACIIFCIFFILLFNKDKIKK